MVKLEIDWAVLEQNSNKEYNNHQNQEWEDNIINGNKVKRLLGTTLCKLYIMTERWNTN